MFDNLMNLWSPLEQFEVRVLGGVSLCGIEISLTSASVYIGIVFCVACLWLFVSSIGGYLIPGPLQVIAEEVYRFVFGIVRQQAGEAGLFMFPLIFSTFLFVFLRASMHAFTRLKVVLFLPLVLL